ncbi:hypothetical protein Esti_000963 [Eimeria stiedai]
MKYLRRRGKGILSPSNPDLDKSAVTDGPLACAAQVDLLRACKSRTTLVRHLDSFSLLRGDQGFLGASSSILSSLPIELKQSAGFLREENELLDLIREVQVQLGDRLWRASLLQPANKMGDVPESWEDVVDELEEPAPPPPPPKQTSSPFKANSSQTTRKKFQEEEDFLDDPVAERLRRERTYSINPTSVIPKQSIRDCRLVEESEKRLVDDFFAGCERPDAPPAASAVEDPQRAYVGARAAKALAASTTDAMDAVHLKTYGDCERFVEALSKKILESPAKSPAWLRLLDLLLKECSPKMDLKASWS